MSRRRAGGAGTSGPAVIVPDPRFSNNFRNRMRCRIPAEKLLGSGSLAALPLRHVIKNPHLQISTVPTDPAQAAYLCFSDLRDVKLETLTGTDIPFRIVSFTPEQSELEVEFLYTSLTGNTQFEFFVYVGQPEATASLQRPDLVAAPFVFKL